MPTPWRKQSRMAFNLDLVVGVDHPHELKVRSPDGVISQMRFPCNRTVMNPSWSKSTEVFAFCQSLRLRMAVCISISILRIRFEIRLTLLIYMKKPPCGGSVCHFVKWFICWPFSRPVHDMVWRNQRSWKNLWSLPAPHTDGLPNGCGCPWCNAHGL